MDTRLELAVIAFLTTVAAGGWSIAAYCARLVLRGDLVPRKTHQDALDALRMKDESILTELTVIREASLTTGKTLHKFIRGLQRVIRAPGLNEEGDE